MNILLTGATGFVGSTLLNALTRLDHQVTAVVRGSRPDLSKSVLQYSVDDISTVISWAAAVEGKDLLIHAAARVHVMNEVAQDPLEAFRKVNVDATLRLANDAAQAGVKRFVFVSSIKVNGESTLPGVPFGANSIDCPQDAYGISKQEAESGLLKIAASTGMEVVIIRPVLVYGPGVGANFLSMMRWVRKGVPLPLGAINNRRSFVSIDNLVDFIITCAIHPAAANNIFLISDDDDMSTSQLLSRMSKALGVSNRLIPVPAGLLIRLGKLAGKSAHVERLCGSLQVDISKARSLLGWRPVISVDKALSDTAAHFEKGLEK